MTVRSLLTMVAVGAALWALFVWSLIAVTSGVAL